MSDRDPYRQAIHIPFAQTVPLPIDEQTGVPSEAGRRSPQSNQVPSALLTPQGRERFYFAPQKVLPADRSLQPGAWTSLLSSELSASMHDPHTISERARWALSRMIADGVPPTPQNYAAYFEGQTARDDLSGGAGHLRHAEDCEKRCHDLLDAPAAALSDQADRLIQATVAHRAQLADGRQNIEANLALAHAALPRAVDGRDARVFIAATAEKVVLAIAQAQSTLIEYAQRIADLKAEVDRTRAIVRTDALTGAINQGGMRESAQEEYDKATRDGVGLMVVAIDLDDFRAINNTYGHPVGDRVLQCFARRVRQSIRQSDAFIRSGGEEFLLIFPDADANGAAYVVDRIRTSFEKPIEMKPGTSITASFSAGLAAWRPGESVDSVIDRADAALLEAKRRGKRRNVLWDERLANGALDAHG